MFQGGSVIRLFHKELEAYMVGEGLFDDEVTEDGEALGRKKVARFQGHLLDLGGLFIKK